MRNNQCLHSLKLFFQATDVFLFIFSLFLRFAQRGKESIHNENHWQLLLHGSAVEWQIDCFACSAAYFSFFPKENAFQSPEENLWTITQKTEFPHFSLTLMISKIYPDFSLTLKNLFFPDFSLTVTTNFSPSLNNWVQGDFWMIWI